MMSDEEKYMRNAVNAWEETERVLEFIGREIRNCNYGTAQEKAEELLDLVKIYGDMARRALKGK